MKRSAHGRTVRVASASVLAAPRDGSALSAPAPLAQSWLVARALAFAVILLATACEKGAVAPQEPYWGKQACAHCSMLVSEKPSSAQAVLKNGQRKFFDDVGCLVAWEEREHPELVARWVRGPGGEGWVDPAQTRFAEGQTTPMDFGFIAADEGVTFDVVRAAVAKKSRPSNEVTP